MKIALENNIPYLKRGNKQQKWMPVYDAMKKMNIGQSFLISKELAKSSATISNTIFRFVQKMNAEGKVKKKFVYSTTDDGWRVWRMK